MTAQLQPGGYVTVCFTTNCFFGAAGGVDEQVPTGTRFLGTWEGQEGDLVFIDIGELHWEISAGHVLITPYTMPAVPPGEGFEELPPEEARAEALEYARREAQLAIAEESRKLAVRHYQRREWSKAAAGLQQTIHELRAGDAEPAQIAHVREQFAAALTALADDVGGARHMEQAGKEYDRAAHYPWGGDSAQDLVQVAARCLLVAGDAYLRTRNYEAAIRVARRAEELRHDMERCYQVQVQFLLNCAHLLQSAGRGIEAAPLVDQAEKLFRQHRSLSWQEVGGEKAIAGGIKQLRRATARFRRTRTVKVAILSDSPEGMDEVIALLRYACGNTLQVTRGLQRHPFLTYTRRRGEPRQTAYPGLDYDVRLQLQVVAEPALWDDEGAAEEDDAEN